MTRYPAIAALLAACPAFADADMDAGRAYLEANCSACHATGAEGDSPNLQAPPFRLLGRAYPVEHLAEALAEGIFVGHEGMPEISLPPEEIANVLAWLEAIQR